jgi:hypothetical protein
MQPEHRSPATSAATDTGELPVVRTGTLDGWLRHSWDNGVQIDTLEDLQALRVETLNSTYDLAIVSARSGEILMRGGRYFPDWTKVQFAGCSLGGGLLKRHGLYVGLRMEVYYGGRLVMTSPVQAITRSPDPHFDRPPTRNAHPAPPSP